jgi:parallel beta-helix repeat protein
MLHIDRKRFGLAILVIAMLLIVVLVQFVGPALGEQGAPVERPLQGIWTTIGDWTIQNNDDITHSDKTIRLNGDLDIENGGKLTLTNVKLEVNSLSQANPLAITVESGGELILENCNVTEFLLTNVSQPDYYEFNINGDATINNTEISYLWAPQQFFLNTGLTVTNTNDVTITNCSIYNCLGTAIYLDNSDAYLAYNQIFDNEVGIYSVNSNPIISDNEVYSNPYGIRISSSGAGIIKNNDVHHNSYGIDLEDADVLVFNNSIYEHHTVADGAIIQYEGHALRLQSSDAEIANNSLYDNSEFVVEAYNSRVDFHNNTISDGGFNQLAQVIFENCDYSKFNDNVLGDVYNTAFDSQSCYYMEFKRNTVSNCDRGFNLEYARYCLFEETDIYDVDYGIQFNYNCRKTELINCTIASDILDLYLFDCGDIYAYNTTFDANKVYLDWWWGYYPTFDVYWIIDIHVADKLNNSLSDYNVSIRDKYYYEYYRGKTDSGGFCRNIWLQDYRLEPWYVKNFNPYYINIWQSPNYLWESEYFTESRVYEFVVPIYTPGPPGDWIVNSTEYYNDTHLDENFLKPDNNHWEGNLTIQNGGRLFLDNVSLELQTTSQKEYRITVEYGGELIMRNGSIFNKFNSTSSPYTFEIEGEATLFNNWFNYTYYGVIALNDNISIDYCKIPVSTAGHGVVTYYSSPSITNNTISTSNYGIYSGGFSSPFIYNNELTNCLNGIAMGEQSFGTILYNDINNNGGNGIHLESSSPLVKNNYIYNNGGNGIYLKGSKSEVFGNNIYNNDFSGVYCDANTGAEIELNTIYDNDASGITVSATEEHVVFADLLDNNIYGNNYGISVEGADPFLDGNDVYNNTNRGISVTDGGEPQIWANNTIHGNAHGLYFDSSAGLVQSANISYNSATGIYLTGSKPVINNTSFYNNLDRGIYAYSGSDALVTNCDFQGMDEGIEAYSSSPRIEACTFDNNNHSLYLTSASPIIGNSTFYSANTKHFYLSVAYPKSIDNTFPSVMDVYLSEPMSLFYYSWWVDVKVIDDKFNPLPNATVQILDQTTTKVVDSGVDNKGIIWGLVLHEYSIQDNNNDKDGADWALSIPEKTDLTPHNLTAICKGFENTSKIVTINKNYLKRGTGEIVIQMKKPGGGGPHDPPTAPTNIQPDTTHSLKPNITWSASTDYSGLGVKYHFTLKDNASMKIYDDIVTNNTYFNITSDLSYGDGFNSYYIEIFAEDGDNMTSDLAEDVISIFNTDPILNPIGDKNVTAGDTLSFSISATDTDTNPTDTITYGTDFSNLTFNTGTGAVSWTPGDADSGNHSVNFTATDNIGGWDFEVINIWVKPGAPNFNTAPIANAGPDNTSIVNESVILNGTGSFDPDNDTIDYHWEVDHKNYSFSIANSATPSFTPNETGVWTIKLRVKDQNGTLSLFSGYDEMNLTVIDNTPPVAVIDEPLNNSLFGLGERIFFNGSSSSDVNTHQLLTYIWYTNMTESTTDNWTQIGAGKIFNTTDLPEGLHTIKLEVKDSPHDAIGMDTIWIEVSGAVNQPPIPVIKKPVDGSLHFKMVDFDATETTDPENDPLQYTWESNIDGIIETDDDRFTARLSEGDHTITLSVSDGDNNVSVSVDITVENLPPVADFTNNAPKGVGEPVTFDASKSYDPDGIEDEENFTYSWDFGDGTTGQGLVVNHTYSQFGFYTVNLTVTDDESSTNTTAYVEMDIRINSPPVPDAGPDHTVMINEMIEFDGSGTTDEDDVYGNLTFNWDFGDGFIAAGDITSHSYSISGTFNVTLSVSDGMSTAKDTAIVTVKGAGLPPVARAGEDRTVNYTEGASLDVSFDGTLSYDPADDANGNQVIDGFEMNNLTYLWDFGDGSNSTLMSPSHTFDAIGIYTVWLFVTNPKGMEANDSVRITLNQYPVAEIQGDKYGLINKDVSFDADLSYDPDEPSGSIKEYNWDFDDGTKGTGRSVGHKFTNTGKYTVKLTVTDNKEASSLEVSQDTFDVEIFKVPTPSIDSPSEGQEVSGVVTISGSASAPSKGDFTLTGIKISFDGGKTWVNAVNDAGDWTAWTYEWDTKDVSNNASITVRASVDSSHSDTSSITVEKKKASEDGGTDAIMIAAVIGIVVILILIIVAVAFWVRGKKKKDTAAYAYAEGEEWGEEDEDYVQEEEREEKPKFKIAPAAGAKTPPKPTKPAAAKAPAKPTAPARPKAKEQPIKCPKCTELFIVQDTGQRPLKTKCPNCGAKGMIRGTALKPGKEEKVNIKCPKCSRIFKISGDEKYFECPKCHTKGTLSDTVVDKIKDKLGKTVSPLGAAFAGLDRKKVLMESIKCPVCKEKFDHPEEEKKIECPSCGVKGTL